MVDGLRKQLYLFVVLMAPPQKKARKLNKFLTSHEAKYGLRICECDAVSGEVKLVVCSLCVVFGHEVKDAAKRTSTTRSKYFETLRTDHYVQHLKQHHAQKRLEYTNLCGGEDR